MSDDLLITWNKNISSDINQLLTPANAQSIFFSSAK